MADYKTFFAQMSVDAITMLGDDAGFVMWTLPPVTWGGFGMGDIPKKGKGTCHSAMDLPELS